jgi:hypothetical protein
MSENTDDVPLTKTKRYYEKTPARLASIEKMVAARRKNQEIEKAQKILHAENVLKKNGVEVPPKPELKREETGISKEEQKKKLKEIAGDEYDSDAEVVVIKKKKPKKKIIIEESESDEEPIIVKKKKEPKETVSAKPSRVLQVNNTPPPPLPNPPKQPEKIDYRAMFC